MIRVLCQRSGVDPRLVAQGQNLVTLPSLKNMKSTFILPPTLSSNGNDDVDCSSATFTSFIDNEISLGNAWSKFYSTTNIPNPTTVLLPSASILMHVEQLKDDLIFMKNYKFIDK
ncbi:hypothetical protein DEO72_LG3g1897 [Vigna unguiculata]|uniref:Uncharacterized protein n=1 Tax=Vigna unguiculata TaxID=3917 RepID=A0A4D6LFU7_VIGUN|nr:hypothetical protein DEO72_LG3g1897 [Vigna unguiculata]